MPLRNPAEDQKSFVRLVHTKKGGRRGEQLPGRLWIDWADPVEGLTCSYCLRTDHVLCNLKERYTGGKCACNLCAYKHRRPPKRVAVKAPGVGRGVRPAPYNVDHARQLRKGGKSWREIGKAVGADHGGIRKRAVREGWA